MMKELFYSLPLRFAKTECSLKIQPCIKILEDPCYGIELCLENKHGQENSCLWMCLTILLAENTKIHAQQSAVRVMGCLVNFPLCTLIVQFVLIVVLEDSLQSNTTNVALIFLEYGVIPEHISMILLLLESGDIVILAATVKYISILQALKMMTCGVKTSSEFKFTLVATVTRITQQIHLSLEIEDHSMQN